jgi:hypothetical protein
MWGTHFFLYIYKTVEPIRVGTKEPFDAEANNIYVITTECIFLPCGGLLAV